MPPVVAALIPIFTSIGFSVAVATQLVIATLFTAGTLVLGAVSRLLTSKPSAPSFSQEAASRAVTARQAIAPWRILVGRSRVGGVLTFITTTGSSNEFLQMVITLAGHQIHAITAMYFDGVLVPLDGSGNATGTYAGLVHVEYNLGSPTQTAFAGLVAAAPAQWTANHRQRGRAGAYVQLKWDVNKFPNGIPNITFDVQGAEVFDPRTATTIYSENPAVWIRNYLTNSSYGLGVSAAEIDDASFIAAANICDSTVALLAGGTELKYTANGSFESNLKPSDAIQSLLTAMAGHCVYIAGKWSVYAGAWVAPTVALGDGDLRKDIKVQTRLSRRELANGVKGLYISPTNNWQAADFPAKTNAAYVTEDNGEVIWKDISLPFTISATMAQRLAKIELETIRRQITVDYPCKLSGYQVQPPNVVQINRARYGWVNKTFLVSQAKLVSEADDQNMPALGVDLVLRETDSTVYDWNPATDEITAAAPSTSTLPNTGSVQAPTGLALTSGSSTALTRTDGIRISRIKAAWTAPADQFVTSGGLIHVQLRLHAGPGPWSEVGTVNGDVTEFYIDGVSDGVAYDVQLIAENANGTRSAVVQALNHTVSGPGSIIGGGGSALTTTIAIQGKRLLADISDLLMSEQGQNLVQNPSFEQDWNPSSPTDGAPVLGWQNGGNNLGTVSTDVSTFTSGTRCLLLDQSPNMSVPAGGSLAIVHQTTMPIVGIPDQWYILRLKARYDRGGTPPVAGLTNHIRASLRCFDGANIILTEPETNHLLDADNGTFFKTLTLTLRVPTQTTRLQVVLWNFVVNSTGGALSTAASVPCGARFDQVELIKATDSTSDELTKRGSTPPAYNGSLSYTSTTTSLAWSWNIDVLRTDSTLSSQNINSSQTCTGLVASTTYYHYPFMSEASLLMDMVATGGTGTPAWAHAAQSRAYAQEQARGDHVPLSTSAIAAATTAAGTGGGGGGGDGSCVKEGTWVKEKTRGIVRVETIRKSEFLWAENDTWLPVLEDTELVDHDEWIRTAFNCNQELEVTTSHPWTLRDRSTKKAPTICLEDEFICSQGVAFPTAVAFVRDFARKAIVRCEFPHMFWAATNVEAPWILTHNMIDPT